MPVKTLTLQIDMKGNCQVENITEHVRERLESTGLREGVASVFIRHTTASVMVIEDEPGIRADTQTFWDRLIPSGPDWQHNLRNPGEDNGHSHLRGQLQGCSLVVPFVDRTLALGTWQQIVLIDFDTSERTREVIVQFVGE